MKKSYLIILGLASALMANAQLPLNSSGADGYLSRGLSMYEDKNYSGCIDQLTVLKQIAPQVEVQEEADYYIALSKYKRGDADCLKALHNFIVSHPGSARRCETWFAIGDYYFINQKYGEAINAFNKVADDTFIPKSSDELIYRRAFCYLKLAEFDKAQEGFNKLKGSRKYRESAVFYAAYIHYIKGNYASAEEGFNRISNTSVLKNEARYYICQIRFEDQDYSTAVSIGNSLLNVDFPQEMKAELRRVVGESEYNLGNNSRAVEMLNQYMSLCTSTPQRTSLYVLGLAHYRNAEYTEAVTRLDGVTGVEDALAQSAYLYIGQAYLQTENKNAALMAFEKAYKMNFDRDVQETAFYNYAIMQSKGARVPFSNSVTIFEDFLNQFPNSQYAPHVEDYIINSYMASKDYDNALATIAKINNPSGKILKAKQDLLYRVGVREYLSGNAKRSLSYFQKADQLAGYNANIANETSFWLGETYYANRDYVKSQSNYNRYLTSGASLNKALANYGMGYALFQQKKYTAALKNFVKAVDSRKLDTSHLNDAYNRIGDCYYYNRNYSKAESYYSKKLELSEVNSDYALYQKGFMRGLQRHHNDKIEIMDEVVRCYPNSIYAPKAIFEKAQAYIALDKNSAAENTFERLMRDYPKTAEARQGQLQLAMLLNVQGKREEARKQYKALIRKSPSSEEGKVATEDLKVMYANDGNLPDFAQFMKSVDTSFEIDTNEMDRLTFQSAEDAYVADGVTEKLRNYVSAFPNGQQVGQAYYYLAESAYREQDAENALKYVNEALTVAPDASYSETALAIKAEILLNEQDLDAAKEALEKLHAKATTTVNRRIALSGLTRVAHYSEESANVIKYANELLAMNDCPKEFEEEANFYKGVAHENLGDKQEAIADYKKVDNLQSSFGAASTFRLAELYFSDGKYDSSEKLLNKIIESGTPHHYWMARAFILMSDVCKKRGDKFQAREYLESLKANYPGKEGDIFEMIDTRLKALKK